MSNPKALQESLAELRHRASRFHEYVKDRDFDPKLTALYADCLTAIDTYTNFLADMGRVEREAVARVEKERAETGFNAGFTGGSTAAGEYHDGASGGDAALAGLAVGVVEWLLDDYSKGQARDEAKRAAVEAAGRELDAKLTAIRARLENAETDLAAKYEWGQREVRSSDPQAETDRIAALAKEGDTAGALQILDRKIARRPRDAGLLALRDYVASCDAHATAPEMKAAAERCVTRATLVPAGKIYDFHRAQILYLAADITQRAWTKELDGHSWGEAKNTTAAYAVDLWDTVLAYYPGDDDGECRERRAWALMASGNLDDAIKQVIEIQKLRQNTIRYAMNCARLCNAAGQTDNSFAWFQYAVKNLGYNNVGQARTDPDLAAMRQAKAQDFEKLMACTSTWRIEWGVFNDDITLTNTSAYAITNVVLNCHIESHGQTWTPQLKAQSIMPGETQKWENVVSIPGSRVDDGKTSATISCDQNK